MYSFSIYVVLDLRHLYIYVATTWHRYKSNRIRIRIVVVVVYVDTSTSMQTYISIDDRLRRRREYINKTLVGVVYDDRRRVRIRIDDEYVEPYKNIKTVRRVRLRRLRTKGDIASDMVVVYVDVMGIYSGSA